MVGQGRADDERDDQAPQLSGEELLAFAQGELSASERERVEQILDASPEQGAIVAEYARVFGGSYDDETGGTGETDSEAHPTIESRAQRWQIARDAAQSLGRYLVIGELGRGGMGVVLRVYDPRLQREVALKCLPPGGMSEQTQARLVREAQAMAQLSHRNVVSVYDVELTDGRFVLAMEFVEGMNLGQWLARGSHPWRAVLDVFLEAGRGLAAAHAVGLLHRDFKPANVLIADSGEVKVTDFGLARPDESVEGPLTGVPTLLESGQVAYGSEGRLTADGEVMGTPAYMPPEQFEAKALNVAADQYAYCASLWQALTGSLPYRAVGDVRVSALHRLKMEGPPAWPSDAPAVPRWLVEAISRGLSVEPSQRWPSMTALLAELSRDPMRRRRWSVTAGALGAVVVGVMGWQAYDREATRSACEREGQSITEVWNQARAEAVTEAFEHSSVAYAPQAWARAQPRVESFAQAWAQTRTDICLQARVEHARSPSTLNSVRSCLDEQRTMVDRLVEHWSTPDDAAAERVGIAAWGLPQPHRCTDEDELRHRGEEPDDPEARDAIQALRERSAGVSAQIHAGQYEQALVSVERILAESEALGRARLTTNVRAQRGDILLSLGRYEEAVQQFESALDEAFVAGDDDGALRLANLLAFSLGNRLARPKDAWRWVWLAELLERRLDLPKLHPDRAVSFNNRGVLHMAEGEYEQALAAYREALAIRRATLGPEHPEVATMQTNIAVIYTEQGLYDEALISLRQSLELRERTLGPEHPDVAYTLNNLGNIYTSQARYEQALAVHQRALAIREVAFSADHPDIATSLVNIGSAYNELGSFEEALAFHQRALAMFESTFGAEHPNIASVLNNVGNTYKSLGRYDEALGAYERARTIIGSQLGTEHPKYALSLNNVGIVHKERGELDEAMALHRRAIEIWSVGLGEDHPYVAAATLNMGTVLHEQGRYEEALGVHQEALALWEATLEPEHPYVGIALYNVGLELVELGRAAEATPLLLRSIDLLGKAPQPPAELGEARFALARARWDGHDDRRGAVAMARSALEELRRTSPHRTEFIAKLRRWIRARRSDLEAEARAASGESNGVNVEELEPAHSRAVEGP